MDRQFPLKVVVLIVEASLDPYDSFDMLDDYSPRYSTLCSYSRLNSTWRDISKPLLYESVVVETDKAGEKLLEVIERKDGDELGMIRSLRVFDNEQGVTMRRLVKRMYSQVESLALEGVDIGPLPFANRLRRLLLQESSFAPLFAAADPSILSQLQYLEIEESYRNYDLGTPQSLSSLRSLSLTSTEKIVIAPALLNTLTALHLDDEGACRRFLPHAKNLLLLSISDHFDSETAFSPLAATPRFVRLGRYSVEGAVYSMRYQIDNKKSGLETIFWDEGRGSRTGNDREATAVIRCTGELSGKGIKVIRGNISFRDAVERVDAILGREKRAKEDKERAAM